MLLSLTYSAVTDNLNIYLEKRYHHVEVNTAIAGNVPTDVNIELQNHSYLPIQMLDVETIIRNETAMAGYSLAEQNRFVVIARYESGLNPNAIGYATYQGKGFLGLFQIFEDTWYGTGCSGYIFNPTDNVRCAIRVQKDAGWKQWEVVTVFGV